MPNHRTWVAALAAGLLGIALPAAAQGSGSEPDPLEWALIDEDCGHLDDPPVTPEEPAVAHEEVAIAAAIEPEAPARAPRAREETPTTPAVAHAVPSHDGTLPRGRAVGALTPDACEEVLRSEGVSFEREASDAARSAIAQPIRLTGALRGVRIRPHGGDESSIHSIIDCRLAVALLGWADELREAGFVAIEHVSIFRPGARVAGTHRPSGHSHALALDALRFVRADGTFFSVLDDWAARVRGTDPCATYDEPAPSATVRHLVCSAVAAETFQVVITPHHDDAHANHVHLEIVPGVTWTVAR
jgi:hypothetical protein